MIIIDNIANVNLHQDFENIIIMRRLLYEIKNAKQEICLSPSQILTFVYLEWKSRGIWNNKCFEEKYAPLFIQQIKRTPEALSLLNDLYKRSKTDNIALYCFCENEELCHRSIIAGMLLGAGADINCNPEYIKYWNYFKTLK